MTKPVSQTTYPPSGPNPSNNDGDDDQIEGGFDTALHDQQLAFKLSRRNKLDDLHNKAILKGIDNAAGYI